MWNLLHNASKHSCMSYWKFNGKVHWTSLLVTLMQTQSKPKHKWKNCMYYHLYILFSPLTSRYCPLFYCCPKGWPVQTNNSSHWEQGPIIGSILLLMLWGFTQLSHTSHQNRSSILLDKALICGFVLSASKC